MIRSNSRDCWLSAVIFSRSVLASEPQEPRKVEDTLVTAFVDPLRRPPLHWLVILTSRRTT